MSTGFDPNLSRDVKLFQGKSVDFIRAIDAARSDASRQAVRHFVELWNSLVANQKSFSDQAQQQLEQSASELKELRVQAERQMKTLQEATEQFPDDREAIEQHLKRLGKQVESLNPALGLYWSFRLRLANEGMGKLQNELRLADATVAELDEAIIATNTELDQFRRTGLRLQSDKARYSRAQQRLVELYRRKSGAEIPVSEESLTTWLDTFVEVNLVPEAQQGLEREVLHIKKTLFQLLRRYCEQQEDAAKVYSRATHLDSEKAMQFALAQERFLLNYFAEKRKDETQGISNSAAARRVTLKALELELKDDLKDYQRLANQAGTKRERLDEKSPPKGIGGFLSRLFGG